MYNYVGSVGVALGYIALVMLAVAAGRAPKVQDLLAGVGRMAFSNYILMSLLAMFIFYGNGLGLFGSVERLQQLLIVLPIWPLFSCSRRSGCRSSRYGPLEWLWWTLTYLKRQSLVSR